MTNILDDLLVRSCVSFMAHRIKWITDKPDYKGRPEKYGRISIGFMTLSHGAFLCQILRCAVRIPLRDGIVIMEKEVMKTNFLVIHPRPQGYS
jgi:hypothetical protein